MLPSFSHLCLTENWAQICHLFVKHHVDGYELPKALLGKLNVLGLLTGLCLYIGWLS